MRMASAISVPRYSHLDGDCKPEMSVAEPLG
jgi:hypothetical protein